MARSYYKVGSQERSMPANQAEIFYYFLNNKKEFLCQRSLPPIP